MLIKNSITILFLFLTLIGSSQKDSLYYKEKIFIMKLIKGKNTKNIPRYKIKTIYKGDSVLQLKILDYIISFKDDSSYFYHNLRHSVQLASNFLEFSEFYSVRKKALEYQLKMWNYPLVYPNNIYLYYVKKKDLSSWVKKRITELLNCKFSEHEYNISYEYEEKQFRYILKQNYSSKKQLPRIKRIISKTGNSRTEIIDSLVGIKVKSRMKSYIPKPTPPNKLVYMLGIWDLKETIPLLKEKLNTKQNKWSSEYGKMALARMGEEDYVNIILNSISKLEPDNKTYKKIFHDLTYIAHQKCIEIMAAWLFSENKYAISEYSEGAPIGHFIVWILDRFIINKPKDTKYNTNENDSIYGYNDIFSPTLEQDLKPELLKINHEWINKNKGKFVLNRDYIYR